MIGVLVLAVAAAVALAAITSLGDDEGSAIAPASFGGSDPLAFDPARRAELEARAAAGVSHVLYANSPGGVAASARRTARFRDRVEAAAGKYGIDPDVLEAIVLLESAGRPDVIAGADPGAASGLAQIIPSTAQDLLGMQVDLERSKQLTREMVRVGRRGRINRFRRLRAERARVDERFDPEQALEGAARYLQIATARFGGHDLAVESYHMGIGNLARVIRTYVAPEDASGAVRELVGEHDLTYAQLFFDSSPLRNPETWELLASFGDESSEYYWKVLAALGIMRLYREDRAELRRLARLHGNKATAEEVFHPPDRTESFDEPGELEAAWRDGEIVPIPEGPGSGYVLADQLGELAPELGEDPALYAGLRPEALSVLIQMAREVREIGGADGSLIVTGAVRDGSYQELLRERHAEATDDFPLHATGWSFDIWRRYESDGQAQAFQFVLDRLQALAVIDYAVEPESIHVTVSDQVAPLME